MRLKERAEGEVSERSSEWGEEGKRKDMTAVL